MIIESKTLYLRPTTETDLNYMLSAQEDPDNQPFIVPWSDIQHRAAFNDPDIAHLIIEALPAHHKVGFVILGGLQSPNQSIEFVRLVITEKNKGYARETLRLLMKWAFEEKKAHRLWLRMKEESPRSRRLYESQGFLTEGVLREVLKTGDKYESLVVMSLLEHEYRKD